MNWTELKNKFIIGMALGVRSTYYKQLLKTNGDSRKQEIAFAQNYFAVQTLAAVINPDSGS